MPSDNAFFLIFGRIRRRVQKDIGVTMNEVAVIQLVAVQWPNRFLISRAIESGKQRPEPIVAGEVVLSFWTDDDFDFGLWLEGDACQVNVTAFSDGREGFVDVHGVRLGHLWTSLPYCDFEDCIRPPRFVGQSLPKGVCGRQGRGCNT